MCREQDKNKSPKKANNEKQEAPEPVVMSELLPPVPCESDSDLKEPDLDLSQSDYN